MANIKTIFWDVGGVILRDGWDQESRLKAAEKFGLKADELEDRHDRIFFAFEKGELGLDQYLDQTVFTSERAFSRQDFKEFMFAQSRVNSAVVDVVRRVAGTRQYLMAMLNNESLELNAYRIHHFQLRQYFTLFLSSCYLGMRKPEESIYRLALQVTQTIPEETLMIDDRPSNLEVAQRLQMNTIHFLDAAQLEKELKTLGVEC